MKIQLVAALLLLGAATPQSARTFTGTITDAMCDRADHSHMRMGPTDAECAIACADEHDAAFVLYDGKEVYNLTDQASARKFAGRKVRVSGTLDAPTKTIAVRSIASAN